MLLIKTYFYENKYNKFFKYKKRDFSQVLENN